MQKNTVSIEMGELTKTAQTNNNYSKYNKNVTRSNWYVNCVIPFVARDIFADRLVGSPDVEGDELIGRMLSVEVLKDVAPLAFNNLASYGEEEEPQVEESEKRRILNDQLLSADVRTGVCYVCFFVVWLFVVCLCFVCCLFVVCLLICERGFSVGGLECA